MPVPGTPLSSGTETGSRSPVSSQTPGHFGVFDFPAYLESQGIGMVMRFPDAELIGEDGGAPFYRWLYSLRRDMARAMSTVIPEPQASFGQAILLGIRDTLPESLNEDFRRAGTAHLLAISGLHVGILLALSISASEFLLGRRRQFYLALPLLAIWMYALMSGASDSAIRAAVMGNSVRSCNRHRKVAKPYSGSCACCRAHGGKRT